MSNTEHQPNPEYDAQEALVEDVLVEDDQQSEVTEEATVEMTPKQIAKSVRKLSDDEIVKIVQAAGDADRNLELARRQTAEMENVRKRLDAQRQRDAKYAISPLVRDLLDTLDNLERAMKAADGNEAAAGVVEGLQMTLKLFEQSLAKHGVSALEPVGVAFDPEFHDAVMTGQNAELENNFVIACFERGWILHDRVIRPAKVQVNKLED